MPGAMLNDRGIVAVEGAEAAAFLDRIVTCDVDRIAPGGARFGALLSPQGKILADFILFRAAATAFLLDTPALCAADLAKRLGLYRLRAKITIADRSADLAVVASEVAGALACSPDPRLPALGARSVVERSGSNGPDVAQDERRIALGVPQCGPDFAPGELFPHEALMDQLAGVDFDKGCYVGQEIVSRMQHRGTARTRFVSVRFDGPPPADRADIVAGDRSLGRMAGTAGSRGLALLRVDRAGEALAGGATVEAAGVALRFEKPDWIRFPYPAELKAPAAA